MYKTFLALVVLLCLVAVVFAQDARRYSTDPTGFYGEAIEGNSQYIYIRVTMAGAAFAIDNGDWVIGDAATPWYCWAQNVYHSADANNRAGAHPPSWINAGAVPYNNPTANDCPILWNQGGVALDFILAVVDMDGWNYENTGATNRNWGVGINSGTFRNAFQVRAMFLKHGVAGITSNYDDAGEALFHAPPFAMTSDVIIENEARLANTHIVYHSAYLGTAPSPLGGVQTSDWSYAVAQTIPWAEATSYRFNPDHVARPNDGPYSATAKGLGIPPDGRVTIALQLLSPYATTASHAALLGQQQIIRLRVWGVASDAVD